MAIKTGKIDISSELKQNAELINGVISEAVKGFDGIGGRLKEAIEYTLGSPGKRVRAAVALWCCQVVSGDINKDAQTAAATVEMVHTYSLIHDDLPAMDDDDYRRGKPSCHKAFDEATAILTGDALLTMAFELLATKISEPEKVVEMIKTLALAAGPAGMVAGQVDDLQAENGTGSGDDLHNIHMNKTAKMFSASALLGAIAAGASQDQKDLLGQFGLKMGLGFQIADDILDVSSTSQQLGKTAGKDVKQGKLTYPGVFGLAQSKEKAQQIAQEAIELLKPFGDKANILRELIFALLHRTK
ncbi:MAG: polyprenyl synthetase family protein [Sedimentisphaerales bacterium]|nr:polyprenyl synthetase family protein [Sedimentisphaerales bacterium]